jgi:hypothetical protein
MESEMKPFVINRDTWHYKLNKNFFNPYEPWMRQWEARNSDFCSYWRATMFRLLFLVFFGFVFSCMLAGLGIIIYNEPMAIGVIAVILSLFAGAAGLFFLIEGIIRKIKQAPKKESQSLLAQKYRSYKGKFCPKVEFK